MTEARLQIASMTGAASCFNTIPFRAHLKKTHLSKFKKHCFFIDSCQKKLRSFGFGAKLASLIRIDDSIEPYGQLPGNGKFFVTLGT